MKPRYRVEIDATRETLRAENDRLCSHLEEIARLTKHRQDNADVFTPGGIQAELALRGSNRPLERAAAALSAECAEHEVTRKVLDNLRSAAMSCLTDTTDKTVWVALDEGCEIAGERLRNLEENR